MWRCVWAVPKVLFGKFPMSDCYFKHYACMHVARAYKKSNFVSKPKWLLVSVIHTYFSDKADKDKNDDDNNDDDKSEQFSRLAICDTLFTNRYTYIDIQKHFT